MWDSRFWTVSPSLQIRGWNLLDNRQSLPFLHFRRLDFPTILKISTILHCLSYFNVNIERFLINSSMPLKLGWWEVNQSRQMLQCQQHLFQAFCATANLWRSESTSTFCTNDLKCRALRCHLLSLLLVPYQFSILKDMGGWQPCIIHFQILFFKRFDNFVLLCYYLLIHPHEQYCG